MHINDIPSLPNVQAVIARFERKFTKGDPEACWQWQSSINMQGQAQARLPTAGDVTQGASFVGGAVAAFAEGKLRIFGADDGRLTGLFERPLVGKQMGAFGGGHFLATLATHVAREREYQRTILALHKKLDEFARKYPQ